MNPSVGHTTPRSRGQAVESAVRIEALRETGLLDTMPDDSLDRYTRLAAALLGAEVALVSLVDTDRQFFKSQLGLGAPLCNIRETPLSHSFCKYVVEGGDLLAIEDARTDPRVSSNPAVTDYGVVSYLGAPLKTRDGLMLGSLCVVGSQPRKWTETDIKHLTDLAEAVMREIELRDRSRILQETLSAAETKEAQHRQRLKNNLQNLCSPAAAMSSCTEQLAGDADDFKPWQMDLLRRCQASAAGLQRNLRELIANETDTGGSVSPAELRNVTASRIVRRSVRTLQALADDASVTMNVTLPEKLILLHVDPQKIEHVVVILLTNAIQCSEPDGIVSLQVQLVDELGWPRCLISVRDHCSSVPDAQKETLFHCATKSTSLCSRGGLIYCRRVIESHGGQIHVTDAPGGGAIFHFTLPLASPPES
jgi:signal transduction histidine kinase